MDYARLLIPTKTAFIITPLNILAFYVIYDPLGVGVGTLLGILHEKMSPQGKAYTLDLQSENSIFLLVPGPSVSTLSSRSAYIK